MIDVIYLLQLKLVAAGLPVVAVTMGGAELTPNATQQQRDQAAAIVAAFDPVAEVAVYEATASAEKTDLSDLLPQINTELNYISTTLAAIDTMTAAQVRDVVKRILLEQRAELRAWRFVIRRLAG